MRWASMTAIQKSLTEIGTADVHMVSINHGCIIASNYVVSHEHFSQPKSRTAGQT